MKPKFKVGDNVEVLCPALAAFRALVGGKPNHYGKVSGVYRNGDVLVEFPLEGGGSQGAPYPPELVRLRSKN